MNRLLPAVCSVLCLALGFSLGWYFGYSRPVAENQRRLLKVDQTAREAFRAVVEDFSDYEAKPPQFWEAAKIQNEYAALISLQVLKDLEQSELHKAKQELASTVGLYYRAHRRDGNTNLLACIERVATANTALSNAICRKPE
jgi:hypothetical protein